MREGDALTDEEYQILQRARIATSRSRREAKQDSAERELIASGTVRTFIDRTGIERVNPEDRPLTLLGRDKLIKALVSSIFFDARARNKGCR